MKLTRKECLEALDYILNKKVVVLTMKGERILKQLINEHFDNPPLKFEELHKGMPIWDSLQDVWLYVVDVHKDFGNTFTYVWWFDKNDDYYTQSYVEFEPNRYYRKQVK